MKPAPFLTTYKVIIEFSAPRLQSVAPQVLRQLKRSS